MLRLESKLQKQKSSLYNLNIFLVILLFFVISSSVPFKLIVKASAEEYEYSTDGWTLSYNFSDSKAEPDDSITLNVDIESIQKNYDFKFWIKLSEPLYVEEKKGDNSDLHYSELDVGEIRKETFTIIVPSTVQVDEMYTVHLKAQSHNNPRGALNQRLPLSLDPIDYIFETANSPQHAHNIAIMLLPKLKIRKDFGLNFRHSESTFKTWIKNEGKGIAENVNVELIIPDEFILLEGERTQVVGEISSNTQRTLEWKIKTTDIGKYECKILISSMNIDPISEVYQVEVYPMWPVYVLMGIPIVLFILYLVYKIFTYFIS